MVRKELILSGILLVLVWGCTAKPCESGLYTKEGKCYTYVCDKDCVNGYVEGTCECSGNSGDLPEDTNIGSLFDDGGDIKPPVLPT